MPNESPPGRPVLTGSAGVATFVSLNAEFSATPNSSTAEATVAGSVATDVVDLSHGDDARAGQAIIIFRTGHDSVSVGGVASASVLLHDVDAPGGFRIDMDTLHLAGLDSTTSMETTDADGAMHLPGGTRIEVPRAAYVVQSPLA